MQINTNDAGDLIAAIIYTFSAFLLLSFILILFFYFSRKKIIQKEIEKKNLELLHQKKLLHAVLFTQEEERKRIAQDLHDDISSKLNIVSLNSYLLKASNISEDEITEISNNIINLTKKALDNSRRIAHDLLPPVLDKFGLHAGIEELCLEVSSSKSIEITYQNEITFHLADNQKQLHIFRILQELINNSIKHGKATKIEISFIKKETDGICIYKDNGVGMDISNLGHAKGIGIQNIESRISYIGSSITYNTSKGNGMEVIFKI